jgi:hypothetical protein
MVAREGGIRTECGETYFAFAAACPIDAARFDDNSA